ncbi:glutamine--fructose-6-phosphate transaminase (isomerizing) [Flammeovirga pacifica]|uniref:Glutamine--fructose-6-phosphate aminotransferase [isomerizing] n=1 Tax=Flammeovirga pacifica TaxID=915059 RepID=A0A1S1YWA1_FLAPC|nr:glutamine--fructose-6-phosphate transaminase (isomerizing) [Flammeovirga pacifica]OHX65299.1 glutamine--fructose-6-phosphate aminotransferase [Flammeovirga pacifica]
MCGIVGYVGQRDALNILIKGLERLEYRGYDSAGISLIDENEVKVFKCKGKVADLKKQIDNQDTKGSTGIGHTRWATHGAPNDVNAHPHYSSDSNLAMVHNGIIENYEALKSQLIEKGHIFHSDTDTEVFIHFIEQVQKDNNCSLDEAVRIALKEVIGAYAIVITQKDNPGQLVAARKGSPLVIGVGEGEFFLASDATPIIEYTKDVVYIKDEEVVLLKDGNMTITDVKNQVQTPYLQTLELELEAIEKGGYDHFMMKEIMEQPKSVADCLRGRVIAKKNHVKLGGVFNHFDDLLSAKRIIIVACGTSWHAGLVAEYIFEELVRVPVEVEYASEFRYRNPIIGKGDVLIAISQSGETADTLAAMSLAESKGAIVLGVCNVVGSSIARNSHEGAYTHAGPEIGVASTKAFTAQLTVLTTMALMLAKEKGSLTEAQLSDLLTEIESIPSKIEKVLKSNDSVREISSLYKDAKNFLYLGRGFNFPVALEGALKLKEISYIHAEGYPAAEMKHGPIALIDEEMPVVVIATRDSSYDKVVSNLQEVKARSGRVIAVVTEGDVLIPGMVDHVIEVPDTHEVLMPMISCIPLQLLSYHIAVMRGCNVDQPRNLAKSVTVE